MYYSITNTEYYSCLNCEDLCIKTCPGCGAKVVLKAGVEPIHFACTKCDWKQYFSRNS